MYNQTKVCNNKRVDCTHITRIKHLRNLTRPLRGTPDQHNWTRSLGVSRWTLLGLLRGQAGCGIVPWPAEGPVGAGFWAPFSPGPRQTNYGGGHLLQGEHNRANARVEMKWFVFWATILHLKAILGWEQPGLMRWILLWIMPLVQDWSLDPLARSPVHYH